MQNGTRRSAAQFSAVASEPKVGGMHSEEQRSPVLSTHGFSTTRPTSAQLLMLLRMVAAELSQHSAAFRQVVAPGSREQNSWISVMPTTVWRQDCAPKTSQLSSVVVVMASVGEAQKPFR